MVEVFEEISVRSSFQTFVTLSVLLLSSCGIARKIEFASYYKVFITEDPRSTLSAIGVEEFPATRAHIHELLGPPDDVSTFNGGREMVWAYCSKGNGHRMELLFCDGELWRLNIEDYSNGMTLCSTIVHSIYSSDAYLDMAHKHLYEDSVGYCAAVRAHQDSEGGVPGEG